MINRVRENRFASRSSYPWLVAGLLWLCGFFNYADRQAVNSVFPVLEKEFHLSNWQLGLLGSAFMIVYASSAPFAGYVVDLVSRRFLIVAGLGFWSLICAATGFARTYGQLLFFRAAEGLGETFYFPASMSFLSDYHGPRTRSRALSMHQTSVYLGTAGGGYLAGYMGEHHGWQSPFLALGAAGMLYAVVLRYGLIEPVREQSEEADPAFNPGESTRQLDLESPAAGSARLGVKVSRILRNPAAVLLLGVFIGANFVAATFLTWLPSFIYHQFGQGLAASSATSTAFPLASMCGAVLGGVMADWAARHRAGGRILVQSLGLILGAPFVFWAGWSSSVRFLILSLIGAGLCKGVYDANIFASLFDVVKPEDRGTAAGLMNTVGWTGGFLAPAVVGLSSELFGLDAAIAANAAVYLLVGILALAAARMTEIQMSARET